MSHPPTRPGLSGRLKHLNTETPLPPAGFDLDDVVRGGRRRQRRRTVVQVAAAAVAVVALSVGITLPQRHDDGTTVVAPATTAPASSAPAGPAVNLAEDLDVTYRKTGPTVTVTKNATQLATMTLTSADYAGKSSHLVFTFDVAQKLTVDTQLFILWDSESRENAADNSTELTLEPGSHTVTLDFRNLRSAGQAVGWAPSNGEAVWPRDE